MGAQLNYQELELLNKLFQLNQILNRDMGKRILPANLNQNQRHLVEGSISERILNGCKQLIKQKFQVCVNGIRFLHIEVELLYLNLGRLVVLDLSLIHI